MEGAGGRPAGIYVREIECVELRPQDVALGAQRSVRLVLLLASVRVLDDPGEGKIRILGSLRETPGEVIEPGGEPGVMLAQAIHAQGDQLAREKLGERRSHSFEMRAGRDKVHV